MPTLFLSLSSATPCSLSALFSVIRNVLPFVLRLFPIIIAKQYIPASSHPLSKPTLVVPLGTLNISTATSTFTLPIFLSPPTLPHRLSPNLFREYLQLVFVQICGGKFPILLLYSSRVWCILNSSFAGAPHQVVSPTRARSLEPSSIPSSQVPHTYLWQAICMVTILASHGRIFYLLAPLLLYWLLFFGWVIFTIQGLVASYVKHTFHHG